jgi:hypothetical protein
MKNSTKRSMLLFVTAFTSSVFASALYGFEGSTTDDASLIENCGSFATDLKMPGVRVVSAVEHPATAASSSTPALPSHCELVATINERVGTDNLPYAINFRLRVPSGTAWNGKFLFSGGGGTNGSVGDALAVQGLPSPALANGYAVVAQDSGHDSVLDNLPAKSGPRTFMFDVQARRDFGYQSYDVVTKVSKDIIKAYKGRAPDRSYFAGCSEGGREALLMSQRFPADFDGILAGAPGLDLPMATVRAAWMAQAFGPLALSQGQIDRNGMPFINHAYSDADLTVLRNGIIAQCDALDGVVDGMSQNLQACQAVFDPHLLICASGQTSGCLTAAQVSALAKQMGGAKNSAGQSIEVPWLFDPGMTAPSGAMRGWWIGPATATQASSNTITPPLATTHITPPPVFDLTAAGGSQPFAYMLGFNFDSDIVGMFTSTPAYPESAWELYDAQRTDLSPFRLHGGKMMIYQGVADGAFNPNRTIHWWNKVNERNAGAASEFVRLYPVPGMGHCQGGGGPATSSFDMFSSLVRWVENGQPPDSVIATAPIGTPWPGRTRPLCPYPKFAKYKGTGSIEDGSNFTCAVR